MRFYQEITLIPNPDVNRHFLWSKVYQQIHLGLVEVQNEQGKVPIGISFPEYVIGEKYNSLGGKCRLFAQDEAMLKQFDTDKWLDRLNDYVHWTRIRAVPDAINGYATYQRLQPKTSPERLARRYASRHLVDYGDALQRYNGMASASVSAPFIRLKSLSSEQTFCLWIEKKTTSKPCVERFSTYGLSAKATVPEF